MPREIEQSHILAARLSEVGQDTLCDAAARSRRPEQYFRLEIHIGPHFADKGLQVAGIRFCPAEGPEAIGALVFVDTGKKGENAFFHWDGGF